MSTRGLPGPSSGPVAGEDDAVTEAHGHSSHRRNGHSGSGPPTRQRLDDVAHVGDSSPTITAADRADGDDGRGTLDRLEEKEREQLKAKAMAEELEDLEQMGDDGNLQERIEAYRQQLVASTSKRKRKTKDDNTEIMAKKRDKDKGRQRQSPVQQTDSEQEQTEEEDDDITVIEQVLEGGEIPALPSPPRTAITSEVGVDVPQSSSLPVRCSTVYPIFPAAERNTHWPLHHPLHEEPKRRSKLLPPTPIVEQLTAAERTRRPLKYRPNELKKNLTLVKTDRLRAVVGEINSQLVTDHRVSQALWKATRHMKRTGLSFQMRPPKIETLVDRDADQGVEMRLRGRRKNQAETSKGDGKGKGKEKQGRGNREHEDDETMDVDETGSVLGVHEKRSLQRAQSDKPAGHPIATDVLELGPRVQIQYLHPVPKGVEYYDTCLPCQIQGFSCSGDRPVCTQCHHSIHPERCEYVARNKARPIWKRRTKQEMEKEAEEQEETRRRFAAKFLPRNTAAENLPMHMQDDKNSLAFVPRDHKGLPYAITERQEAPKSDYVERIKTQHRRDGRHLKDDRADKENQDTDEEDEGDGGDGQQGKVGLAKVRLDTSDTRLLDDEGKGRINLKSGIRTTTPGTHLRASSKILRSIRYSSPRTGRDRDSLKVEGSVSTDDDDDDEDGYTAPANTNQKRLAENATFVPRRTTGATELSQRWQEDARETERAYRTRSTKRTRQEVAKELKHSRMLHHSSGAEDGNGKMDTIRPSMTSAVRAVNNAHDDEDGDDSDEELREAHRQPLDRRAGSKQQEEADEHELQRQPPNGKKASKESSKDWQLMDQFGTTTHGRGDVRDKVMYAKTWKPWDSIDDAEIGPSLFAPPETSFLRAIHHYVTYYYTYIQSSPDIFESLDLTAQIALGMVVQEVVGEFALKLGRQGQLEDREVQQLRQNYVKMLREEEEAFRAASRAASSSRTSPFSSASNFSRQGTGATTSFQGSRATSTRTSISAADGEPLSATGTYQRLFGDKSEDDSESDDGYGENSQTILREAYDDSEGNDSVQTEQKQRQAQLPPGELARLRQTQPNHHSPVSVALAKARHLLARFGKLPEALSSTGRSDGSSGDYTSSPLSQRNGPAEEADNWPDKSRSDEEEDGLSSDEENLLLEGSDSDGESDVAMDEVQDSEPETSAQDLVAGNEAELESLIRQYEADEDELEHQEEGRFATLAGFEDAGDDEEDEDPRSASRKQALNDKRSALPTPPSSFAASGPSRQTPHFQRHSRLSSRTTSPDTVAGSEEEQDEEEDDESMIAYGAVAAVKPRYATKADNDSEKSSVDGNDMEDGYGAGTRTVTSLSSTRFGAMLGPRASSGGEDDDDEEAILPMSQIVEDDSSSEEEEVRLSSEEEDE